MSDELTIEAFPARARDKIRYGDTDRQGHVNNAVFATFFETGRVEFLYDPVSPVLEARNAFVLARLILDYRAELNWPGEVEIGTRVASIGKSSARLVQAVFQNGRLVASGESVVVLMDEATRRSTPLTPRILERLKRFM
jgi:acyl-CoA thioester hydrolase